MSLICWTLFNAWNMLKIHISGTDFTPVFRRLFNDEDKLFLEIWFKIHYWLAGTDSHTAAPLPIHFQGSYRTFSATLAVQGTRSLLCIVLTSFPLLECCPPPMTWTWGQALEGGRKAMGRNWGVIVVGRHREAWLSDDPLKVEMSEEEEMI
jgi:hypothetical protein